MDKLPNISIIGATGIVGAEIVSLMEERKFPLKELSLYASADSAGEVYSYNGQEVVIQNLTYDSFKNTDICIFATSPDITDKYLQVALKENCKCIVNSSYFSKNDEKSPIIVTEVNLSELSAKNNIFVSPSCSVVLLAPILSLLDKSLGLSRVIVSTYTSVSSGGKSALDELWSQGIAVYNQKSLEIEAFQHQIAFNCIPQIDVMMDDGNTREEYRICNEMKKVLALPELKISITAVRVPIFHGHCMSINVEVKNKFSLPDVVELLNNKSYIKVFPLNADYPMPIDVVGSDQIQIGRIRKDPSNSKAINMWLVGDNIRKGVALNTVQIAESLVSNC